MSDRDLLEAAARAAARVGIKVSWRETAECFCYTGSPYHIAWNPLTDDGDALRLAVACGINLQFSAGATWVQVERDHIGHLMHEPHGTDPCAAIRRAIVRAAAALAKP